MLPPKILTDYLNQIEEVITHLKNVYVEYYREEFLTTERANLKIRLRFNQKYLLEINEAIIVSENGLKTLDYRYHFQDEHNQSITKFYILLISSKIDILLASMKVEKLIFKND